MTKIALTAAALLIAASTAFAGSDKFGSGNASQPAVAGTDNTTDFDQRIGVDQSEACRAGQ
ncbi:hypothetical protein [Mesorhizobium sp. Cs1299R1N3]|uniref:hypothetical protein n=1 Tax=Mesorhizobium sp. Cs1299R1N3 TaxID=3015173 RepID=UPI003FA53FA8